MPITKCLVPGCPSTKASTQLYSLPRTESLRALWLEYLLPLVPSLQSKSKEQLTHLKVCRRHFEIQYIRNDRRVPNSGPTLFSPDEIRSGQPSKPFPSICGKTDHNYCLPVPKNCGLEEPVYQTNPNLSGCTDTTRTGETNAPIVAVTQGGSSCMITTDTNTICDLHIEGDSCDVPVNSDLRVDEIQTSRAGQVLGRGEAISRTGVSEAAGCTSSAGDRTTTRINRSTRAVTRGSGGGGRD